MNSDVMSFTKIKVNQDLLDEIWAFNPKSLEHLSGPALSSYAFALSQYLVYFTYQRNLAKAEQHKLNKYIDRTISIILSDDEALAKKYKTKAAAYDHLISIDTDLMEAQGKLDNIQIELIHIEGMDKTVGELIATLKRELTRRENELYQERMERRN